MLACECSPEAIAPLVRVFQLLIRRRPFLVKGLEATLNKFILSLEFYDEQGRKKIATSESSSSSSSSNARFGFAEGERRKDRGGCEGTEGRQPAARQPPANQRLCRHRHSLTPLLLVLPLLPTKTRTRQQTAAALVLSAKLALPENVLVTLLNDRLVAKGTVLDFITTFFQVRGSEGVRGLGRGRMAWGHTLWL